MVGAVDIVVSNDDLLISRGLSCSGRGGLHKTSQRLRSQLSALSFCGEIREEGKNIRIAQRGRP